MEYKEIIRIHHTDTDAEAEERYERIVARLQFYGAAEVRTMVQRDALPHAWHPIINAWLKDK